MIDYTRLCSSWFAAKREMNYTVARVDPAEVRTVRPGEVINFTLPRGVVDLSTLRMWALASIIGGTAGNRSLPRDVETMIQSLSVWVGDQMVQQTNDYDVLMRALLDYTEEDVSLSRGLLSNGLALADGLGSAVYDFNNSPICFAEWLGLLGSGKLVDTRRAPIRFQVTMAPRNVLMGAAEVTYALDDVHITVTMADPARYDPRAPAALEFDNWRTTMQLNTGFAQQTQLNIATRKLDLILATFVNANYRNAPVSTSDGGAAGSTHLGTSVYFQRGTDALPDALTWNFRVDGKRAIQYDGTIAQSFEWARTLLGKGLSGMCAVFVRRRDNGATSTRTLQQLARNFWLAAADCGGVDLREVDADVMFKTSAPFPSNTSVMSFMAARCRSRLTWEDGKYTFVL